MILPTTYDLPSDLQATLDALPAGLVEHIHRVRVLAVDLAGGHKLDKIRKEISGYNKSNTPITEESLKSQAEFAIAALRNNVKELEARIQPTKAGKK